MVDHGIDEPRKLEDLKWDVLRRIVLLRDGYECQCKCTKRGELRCSAGIRDLDVHHIRPIDRGGTDHISNLITLCRACHTVEGEKARILWPYVMTRLDRIYRVKK